MVHGRVPEVDLSLVRVPGSGLSPTALSDHPTTINLGYDYQSINSVMPSLLTQPPQRLQQRRIVRSLGQPIKPPQPPQQYRPRLQQPQLVPSAAPPAQPSQGQNRQQWRIVRSVKTGQPIVPSFLPSPPQHHQYSLVSHPQSPQLYLMLTSPQKKIVGFWRLMRLQTQQSCKIVAMPVQQKRPTTNDDQSENQCARKRQKI